MSQQQKIIEKLLSGKSDADFDFSELTGLLFSLGFKERIKGSHHIYTKQGVQGRLNLQRESGQAKPYQVKQVRKILLANQLIEP
jgi:predicted RNA binding protein YcfA (HicA-like mRNA interferase family)